MAAALWFILVPPGHGGEVGRAPDGALKNKTPDSVAL